MIIEESKLLHPHVFHVPQYLARIKQRNKNHIVSYDLKLNKTTQLYFCQCKLDIY